MELMMQSDDQRKTLAGLDEAILIAVVRLEDDACGTAVCREVSKIGGSAYDRAVLRVALDRLVRTGLLGTRPAFIAAEKEDWGEIRYRLTTKGREALLTLRANPTLVWRERTSPCSAMRH